MLLMIAWILVAAIPGPQDALAAQPSDGGPSVPASDSQTAVSAEDSPPGPVGRALAALAAGRAGAESEIARLLQSNETAPLVLAGLIPTERLPLSLWRAVSTNTTSEWPVPTRVFAVRLIPRFGSRDAVVRLIALLDDQAPEVVAASLQSLREMTAMGDAWSLTEWKAWGADASAWSDRAWTSAVLTRLAAQSRRMSDRQRILGDEVVSLYRRLHVELEAAGRTTLLAELIRDERAPLRDLGFELAGRDLSARTQLGSEVAMAAASRLSHPDAATRARAATLVSRLVPPDAMLTLTRALQTESEPAAAEPMLLGVARWPNDEAVIPTIRWLERENAPFGAVTTALWSFAQADLLNDPVLRDRIVTNLRDRDGARGGEAAMKLLVRLGTPDDLARVATLLTTPEDPIRNAAAAALAESPDGSLLLIEAASADPRLFAPAARSINAHHAGPDGLRKLASLPAIDPATRETAITDLAARLPDGALAAAVSGAALPPNLAETLLARLAEPERERTPGVLDGLILLANTRVELRKPAEAAVLLDSIDPSTLGESQVRALARVRLAAVIAGGDLTTATAVANTTLDDWLSAWRRLTPSSERRPPVARAILARFPGELTDPQRTELVEASREIAPVPPPPASGSISTPETGGTIPVGTPPPGMSPAPTTPADAGSQSH